MNSHLSKKYGYGFSLKSIDQLKRISVAKRIRFSAMIGLTTLILSSLIIFNLTGNNPWDLEAMSTPPYEILGGTIGNDKKDESSYFLTLTKLIILDEKLEQCKEILTLIHKDKDNLIELLDKWQEMEDSFDQVFLLHDIGDESSSDDVLSGLESLYKMLEEWKLECSSMIIGLDDSVLTKELRLLISDFLENTKDLNDEENLQTS